MVVLVTYDIHSLDPAGQRRLRRIAKACLNFGQRVQYSVFECEVTPVLWTRLKALLLKIYLPTEDSLRFYFLGDDDVKRAEHHGTKPSRDFKAPLIV